MTRLLRLLPNHWPIGVKLFALIIAVAVIPLAIGFYVNYQESRKILLEQGHEHLEAFGKQLGRYVEAYLDHRFDELKSLTADEALQTREPVLSPARGGIEGAERRLAALLRIYPEFVGLSLAGMEGTVRVSAGQRVLEDLGGREFFVQARGGAPAVSRPFLEGGRAVLAFAVPVPVLSKAEGRAEEGAITGVLVLYAPAEELWKMIEEMRDRAMPGSVAILSDRQGIRLAHSTRRDLIFQSWAPLPPEEARELLGRKVLGEDVKKIEATDLPEVQEAVRQATPPLRLTHRLVIGGTYRSVFIPIRQTGWVLLSSVPEESFLVPLEELRRKILLFLALVVVVAVLISLAATWYALRPARLFTRAAERVRAGDLAAQVVLRRRDEIGEFAETFNAMIRVIRSDRDTIELSCRHSQLLKEYYEKILQEATVVLFLLGADGRMKHANRKAEEVLGYAPGDLVGKSCESLLAIPNDPFHQRFARMFEGRGSLEREHVALRAKDGSVREMLCTLTTLTSPSGEPEAAVFGLDVTEEQAIQEKWERVEKLALLGQLAAGVAHEMRNYLTPMVGYTELLREREALSEEGRLGLGRLMQGAQGLQRMVRQLTGFARPSAEDLRPVQIPPLLEEIVTFFSKDLARRRIIAELQMGSVPAVQADPGGLQQIFLNLVTNALQAMGEGGVLRLKAGRCPDGSVEIVVEDTGPGIPEEALPCLFTPFFSTKPPGEGTGLGLFICRQIAERMGGRIDVRSRPGEGATFVLSLKPVA